MSDINKIKTEDDVLEYYDLKNWEEVPDEDLWEDGEITERECQIKIINRVLMIGDWKLIRKKENNSDK